MIERGISMAARQRTCKACSASEADGVPFPIRGLLCRKCVAAKEAQRYQENRESIIARDAQHYKDNKERRSSKHAQYHRNNKERVNAQDRKEYAEKAKEAPSRPCIDCGAPMPPRAQKYCAECKEKHRMINVQHAIKRYRKK
jgi:NMD protein affecting ribosome stability and mRNA decay